jgi:hypothetical protein
VNRSFGLRYFQTHITMVPAAALPMEASVPTRAAGIRCANTMGRPERLGRMCVKRGLNRFSGNGASRFRRRSRPATDCDWYRRFAQAIPPLRFPPIRSCRVTRHRHRT